MITALLLSVLTQLGTCKPGAYCQSVSFQTPCVPTASLGTCTAGNIDTERCDSTRGCRARCNGLVWSCVPTPPPDGGATVIDAGLIVQDLTVNNVLRVNGHVLATGDAGIATDVLTSRGPNNSPIWQPSSTPLLFTMQGTQTLAGRMTGWVTILNAIASTLHQIGVAGTGFNTFFVAPTTTTRRSFLRIQGTGAAPNNWGAVSGSNDTNTIQRPRMQVLIKTVAAMTSRRIWVDMSTNPLNQTSSNGAFRYVGIRFDTAVPDTNWQLCSANGTTASCVDTGVVAAADTEYYIDLDYSVAGTLTGTVNGTSVSKTTHLPGGANPEEAITHEVSFSSLNAATQNLYWHHTVLSHE